MWRAFVRGVDRRVPYCQLLENFYNNFGNGSEFVYAHIMSRKLNDSRAQRDRFYRDSDMKEKIQEQEAKVRA